MAFPAVATAVFGIYAYVMYWYSVPGAGFLAEGKQDVVAWIGDLSVALPATATVATRDDGNDDDDDDGGDLTVRSSSSLLCRGECSDWSMVFPVAHVILDGVEQTEAADRPPLTPRDV